MAVARALASRPSIVFADEPTGNLDSRSGAEVLALLRRSVDEFGQTVVMVTHDPVAAAFTDRVLFLADGRVVDEVREPDREVVLDRMTRMDARQLDAVAADGTRPAESGTSCGPCHGPPGRLWWAGGGRGRCNG